MAKQKKIRLGEIDRAMFGASKAKQRGFGRCLDKANNEANPKKKRR